MLKKIYIFIIALLLFCTQNSFAGEIYKTKEKNGEIKYTNIKPKNDQETVIEVKTYKNREQTVNTDYKLYPENNDSKLLQEKQNYINDTFQKRALILKEKEDSLKDNIDSTKEYISSLENIIEDFLVNGYFADNYIFELRVQESNLKKFEKELKNIKEEEKQLKKEARKNNVDPGILRVN